MISRFKIQIESGGQVRWADADKVFAHLMERYNKKQQKLQDNFEKRLEKFSESIKEHEDQYDAEMLEDFEEYWTEPNKSGTKMKFELEPTWSLGRRLKKWKRNGFGRKSKDTKKNYNFEKPDGKNFYGYCSKCNKGDFYDPYNFNPELIESKCCNATILDKREK